MEEKKTLTEEQLKKVSGGAWGTPIDPDNIIPKEVQLPPHPTVPEYPIDPDTQKKFS